MNARSITDRVSIAGQPSREDLETLAREGYVGVVNLRHDGEKDQTLGVDAEGEAVRALGMDYLHYGVGGAPLTEAGVAAVCNFIDRHVPGRVVLHCQKGGRAAALVLLHQARAYGWSAEEALARAESLGLTLNETLRTRVTEYLATRRTE